MKKIILTLILAIISIVAFSQVRPYGYRLYGGMYIVNGSDTVWLQNSTNSHRFFSTQDSIGFHKPVYMTTDLFVVGDILSDALYNTRVGTLSGNSLTTGYENVTFGHYSGYSITEGISNIFLGYKAGYSTTTADENIALGYNSLYGNVSGNSNISIGAAALSSALEDMNIGIGSMALEYCVDGFRNVGIGDQAGNRVDDGDDNIFLGFMAGYYVQGDDNSIIGSEAGFGVTTGNISHRNVFNGCKSGFGITTGSDNVFSGYQSGYSITTGGTNTFIGTKSGYSNGSGTGNLFLGYQAGYYSKGSDSLYIENSANCATPLIGGDFGTNILTINGAFNTTGNTTLGNAVTDAHTVNGTINVTSTATIHTTTDATIDSVYVKGGSGEVATAPSVSSTALTGNLANSTTKLDTVFTDVIHAGLVNYGTDAEASDTYVVTITGLTLTTGTVLYFYANTANTGACTLNPNGVGAIPLKAYHDQDPPDSYIEAGSMVHCIYDGTNLQILSPDANP